MWPTVALAKELRYLQACFLTVGDGSYYDTAGGIQKLDRYLASNGNLVCVRTGSRNIDYPIGFMRVAISCRRLAPYFSYPAALWRDIKGAALARFERELS
jgi:hypothetical protein